MAGLAVRAELVGVLSRKVVKPLTFCNFVLGTRMSDLGQFLSMSPLNSSQRTILRRRVEIGIEEDVEPEIKAHVKGMRFPPMNFEVIKQVLALLSGLVGTGSIPALPVFQVLATQPVSVMAPKMDKDLGTKVKSSRVSWYRERGCL
uniref:Uncharacterized protein n=1 Tax=Solanum tuberosum TaxID=4113 RepID=M1DR48_SOLTU